MNFSTSLASLDGEIMLASRASVPATDEGLLRGDGVFEAIRIYDGQPFALEDHLDDFLPGASLWRESDTFTRTAAACAADTAGAAKPSAGCADFLKSSEKARQQWELERRFREFEAGF